MLQIWLRTGGRSILRSLSRPRMNVRYVGLKTEKQPLAGTMDDIKQEIKDRLGLQEGYHLIPRSREHLLQYTPTLQELPPRSMQDSFTSAVIPLGSDTKLQDTYVNFLGNVRLGRLMEDMDMFAVWVCHNHLKIPNLPPDIHLPYTFVTILVDKVSIENIRTAINKDIRLSGHVSWVGKSSMEIVVWLEQMNNGAFEKITRALFLMAARNATNTGSAPVNPISPATDEERKILSGGEERKKQRQAIQAQSITKMVPTEYEQSLMHNLFRRTTHSETIELNKRFLPPNCRWMSEWSTSSRIASFPENRNAHNTVFGGFLMRQAVENSFIASFMYSKSRPRLRQIIDISFEKPLNVASIIKMTSYVVYTEVNFIQVMAVGDVLNAATGTQYTTNVFYFTYECLDPVPEILPRSYQETMWYIQGRRKFRYAMGM